MVDAAKVGGFARIPLTSKKGGFGAKTAELWGETASCGGNNKCYDGAPYSFSKSLAISPPQSPRSFTPQLAPSPFRSSQTRSGGALALLAPTKNTYTDWQMPSENYRQSHGTRTCFLSRFVAIDRISSPRQPDIPEGARKAKGWRTGFGSNFSITISFVEISAICEGQTVSLPENYSGS